MGLQSVHPPGWSRLDSDRTQAHAEASTSGRSHGETETGWPKQRAVPAKGQWSWLDEHTQTTVKILISGGAAGAVSKTMTAPLARLTILFQVDGLPAHQRGTRVAHAFKDIIKREGVLSLWKGNGVTIVHRLPYSAINFWTYEQLTEHLPRYLPVDTVYGTHEIVRRLVAGGLAGMVACASAYPLDLLRTRLAAQTSQRYYTGIASALQRIAMEEGVLGLYRGLGATLLQVGPSLALNYCTYETMRSYALRFQRDKSSPTVVTSLACGAVAGLVSSTATFPLDLVRRRMQLVGQGGRCDVRSGRYVDVVREVLRSKGVRGLYAGIVPEYMKVVPGVAVAFCTYEGMKRILGVPAMGPR